MNYNTQITLTMTHGQHLALLMAVMHSDGDEDVRQMLIGLLSAQLPGNNDNAD